MGRAGCAGGRDLTRKAGRDETRFLEPLDRIIEAGRTPAEVMLEKFHGPWGGRVDPVYDEYAL